MLSSTIRLRMKLLLILVSIVAVFTVNGRDFHNEPEGSDTVAGEHQHFPDGTKGNGKIQLLQDGPDGNNSDEETQNLPGGHDNQDSVEQVHQLKVQIGQHERKLKRSRCKARNACVVMAGFCVTNATLCSGRLVPEGCKGIHCQCCVPGTIEAKFNNLEMELQSLKEIVNISNININLELKSIKINMNGSNSHLDSELQSLKDNVNNSNFQLQSIKGNINNSNAELQSLIENMNTSLTHVNSKLESLAEYQGCPKGFFHYSTSSQCFKYFDDTTRSWAAAKSKCAAEGGVLAKPYDPVGLRNYIVLRYGSHGNFAWIGARGTGSSVKWDRDAVQIDSGIPMWWKGDPGSKTSTSQCLSLMVYGGYMKSNPITVYYMMGCTSSTYTLCEFLRE